MLTESDEKIARNSYLVWQLNSDVSDAKRNPVGSVDACANFQSFGQRKAAGYLVLLIKRERAFRGDDPRSVQSTLIGSHGVIINASKTLECSNEFSNRYLMVKAVK